MIKYIPHTEVALVETVGLWNA